MPLEGPNRSSETPAAHETVNENVPSTEASNGMDKLLRETATSYLLGLIASDDSTTGGLPEALSVAKQHSGKPFLADPIAIDLVTALLSARFDPSENLGPTWRYVALPVAAALVEDPASHDLLCRFWDRLQEAVT